MAQQDLTYRLCENALPPYVTFAILNRFFDEEYAGREGCRVIKVRISASEAARASRGFAFSAGVDDAESECGLDDFADRGSVLCCFILN